MLLIDGHVHIYDKFDLSLFFFSAFSNFYNISKLLNIHSYTPVMFIIDRLNSGAFSKLEKIAGTSGEVPEIEKPLQFQIEHTQEELTLTVRYRSWPPLLLIAGRKIITAEGLEVLALSSLKEFQDDRSLIDTVNLVAHDGAIPVVPWAAGKWFGNRGYVVDALLDAPMDCLYLSDNGNRPGFWGWPRHFRKAEARGIRIMSGSDPLPLPSEIGRAGRNGFMLKKRLNDDFPAHMICEYLRDRRIEMSRYGVPETPIRFIRNQLFMQIFKKRHANKA